MKYIKDLDSLRACAALLVIGLHWEKLILFGWVGVQFFFVLSGFLISGIIYNARDEGKGFGEFLRLFYIRRSLRLFPLLYGYVAVLLVMVLLLGRPEQVRSTWIYISTYSLNFLSLFKSYAPHGTFTHMWSLCVEWQLYIIWPLLLWCLPRTRRGATMVLLVAVAPILRILTYKAAIVLPGLVSFANKYQALNAVYVMPWSHIDAFALGALLCNVNVRKFFARPTTLWVTTAMVLISGAAAAYFGDDSYKVRSLGWPRIMTSLHQWIWGYTLLNVLSASILACTYESSVQLLSFTKSKILQYLGLISYGIYVLHPLGVELAQKLNLFSSSHALYAATGLAITVFAAVALASVSYFLWEKRFLRMKEKIKQLPPAAADLPASLSESKV